MSASIITETDLDDDRGGSRANQSDTFDLPANLSDRADGGGGGNNGGGGDVAYEIVDDYDAQGDGFQPLTGPAAREQDDLRGEDEDALANETPEQRRLRMREPKGERRARQRLFQQRREQTIRDQADEIARLRAEADENKQFRSQVETRFSQFDQGRQAEQVAGIQREIDQTAAQIEGCITRMSEAVVSGDAQAHAAAAREQTRLMTRGFELAAQKAALENSSRAQPTETRPDDRRGTDDRQVDNRRVAAPPPLNATAQAYIADFQRRFPWFDGRSNDEDSLLVLEQDFAVARRFRADDPRYWDTLEDRMRALMPHRFEDEERPRPRNGDGGQRQQTQERRQQVSPERRGPRAAPAGGGGGGGGGGRQQVRLTPERKEALISAGVLEQDGRTIRDQKRFQGIAKGYVEYDRTNGAAR